MKLKLTAVITTSDVPNKLIGVEEIADALYQLYDAFSDVERLLREADTPGQLPLRFNFVTPESNDGYNAKIESRLRVTK